MFLKSLDIQGFKSFANKTTVVFLPKHENRQSITAVVGPNGSGKSNIADAIRWVMGEQRMKTLRGKKSDDVIFSGSATKGQLGMASVTLTIDNADHSLPFEYDELVLTRRIYRTGESEYLINGAPARLLDVQLLLARAQFGQGSYSIVGQGMIDRMLLQTATERKVFFDEASGIKELQIKRHQSALKLARTREHMREASALLLEVEPRLKTLSRQLKKLEERKGVEEELRQNQETYYATLWQEYDRKRRHLTLGVTNLDGVIREGQARLHAIQTELATLAGAASRQDAYRALQQEYTRASDEVNRLSREKAVLQGKLQTEYSQAGQKTLGWLEERLSVTKADIDRLSIEVESLQKIADSERERLAELDAQYTALSLERTEILAGLARHEEALRSVKHEERLFQAIGLRAVQAILESRDRFGTVYGPVAALGSIDTRFQVAIDVAAGSHVSSLVVQDEQVAERCIEFLRREELGIATFLPLSTIRPRPVTVATDILATAGVHGRALDLLRFDKRFADIFAFVFGGTVVVDATPIARNIGIGRARMVTLEGDLMEMNGSMKGGFRRRRHEGLSFGSHEVPLAAHAVKEEDRQILVERQQEVEARIADILNEKRSREGAEVAAQTKLSVLSEQKQTALQELARLEQERALLTMSPEEYTEALKLLEAEQAVLQEKVEAALAVQKKAENGMAAFQEEEEEKKRRVFALQDSMQSEQSGLNVLSEERNSKQIELAKYDTKCEDVSQEVFQELHESMSAIVSRGIPTVSPEALEGVLGNIQKLKYKLTLIGGIDEDVIREHEETKNRHEHLAAELNDLEKALRDLSGLVKELDEVMKKRRDKAFRKIKKEFSRYFEILFEGGKADLVEVYGSAETPEGEEGEDMGEAGEGETLQVSTEEKPKAEEVLIGIDIVANPPGKKIKELASLSGGERTMTSIALICAILKTNPSPFVLLDEVEAALDEANTLRFTTILKELAEASQFILISHNRTTMHAADALYGVTMGNDGISQLIGIKLG